MLLGILSLENQLNICNQLENSYQMLVFESEGFKRTTYTKEDVGKFVLVESTSCITGIEW